MTDLEKFDEVVGKALLHRDTPNYWGLTRPETPLAAIHQAAIALVEAELDSLAKLTESYNGKVQLLANMVERIYTRKAQLKAGQQ